MSTALTAIKVLGLPAEDHATSDLAAAAAAAGVSDTPPLASPSAAPECTVTAGEREGDMMAAQVPTHSAGGTMARGGDGRLPSPARHGPYLWTVGTRVFEFLDVGADYPCSPAAEDGMTVTCHGHGHCLGKTAPPPLLGPGQSARCVWRVRRRSAWKAGPGCSPAAHRSGSMGWVWDCRSGAWAFAM